ncbi:MAG: serine/threonine protein phosphatase [Ruminococcaceae bacterium]|nr:serine/threonine protein phosphatase [Oscillospiraceae bacterium]
MTYVTAGIYGDWERYSALLQKINLKEEDVLYVLGDVVDYGEQSMEVLTDMSMRVNVYPVAGERELLALRMLAGFDKMLKEGSMPDPEFAAEMTAWASDGGKPTLDGFRALDNDMREGVLDYLSEFVLFEEVEAKGKKFVLVHAGIANFDPDTALDDYEPEDFFSPAPTGASFFADRTLVVGHTPTESGKIEHEEKIIRIDCGVLRGGSLAALCLENGAEFYA